MTTVWPGSIDSYSVKVDNVDDVLAAHINNPQDAIVALETPLRDMTLMRVKNTSGSTVAANDLGYIDEAGEFKLTTTAYLDVSWAVVVEGAANNADIIATNKGLVTIVCNGNAPVGQYLYTSTTTKQAQPQSYVRPEVMAVVKTANIGGAGGTCVALLLCDRKEVAIASDYPIIGIASAASSDWQTTQDGAPAAAVITYNVALTSGAENTIVPVAATDLFKLVLHNTTRGEEALISSVNTGANTITVTAAADVASWIDTNVLSVRSQTNTDLSAASYWFDLYTESTDIPALATAIQFAVHTFVDSGATARYIRPHPWVAGSAPKRQFIENALITGGGACGQTLILPFYQRRFCVNWVASGAATASLELRMRSAIVAKP